MKHVFLIGSLLGLLFSVSFCYGSANTVNVVGFGGPVDCKENSIKTSQALSGLKVTIDCKLEDGTFQTRGVGKLNEEGQFKVNLPQEILKDGKLSEECHVQLNNATNAPCASKINFVLKSNQQRTFARQLRFTSAISTLSTIWPPFPKSHPWYKRFHNIFPNPPVVLPPIPTKKQFPPPVVKPEPKTEPSPEPNPNPQPKPEPKSNPAPKPELEPKPKAEPKPDPKHKPEPKPKPKPKSKSEPKQPKPKPKPEPDPKPKLEPKHEPKSKPKPKPKPKPNPKPKPCPPKILPPPTQVYKPYPEILPPIPPIH